MQPAIFLDRDNTLILNDGDLGQPDKVRLVDGVPSGLAALREAGFSLVVVTNQAGVARGVFTEEDVDAVHQRIATLIDEQASRAGLIDRFYYCPYHPDGTLTEYRRDHLWRKPHPGMILQAARDLGLDLTRSWVIGDQERDVQAGRSAGCRTVLVSKDAELIRKAGSTIAASDFSDAVRRILEQSGARGESAGGTHNGSPVSPTVVEKPPPEASAGTSQRLADSGPDSAAMRRAVTELTEEIRSDRMRRADFTMLKMLAGLCQLLALSLALLGLMQLANSDAFMKWMIGAGLTQLLTITILVLDLKG